MAALLIDISRSVSRAPFPVPTGIDRVERAYIDHFLQQDDPVWFLTRIFQGYALLDRAGMRLVKPMLIGQKPWAAPDLISRLFSRKKHPALNRAESGIRRAATATSGRAGLKRMLAKHLPGEFTYLNVGHSNRHEMLWAALGSARKIAMIHDVIPLDFPQYTRPDRRARFEDELYLTAQNCDCLIYNSNDTAKRTRFWLDKRGITVDGIVALLGVDPLPPITRAPASDPAEFVILGTIEPRKNHALLLKIWAKMPPENAPHLHIVGRRGWQNEAVFNQLDSAGFMGKTVFEHSDMDDTALSQLLSRASALLFPTYAEGFGYPLVEALQMGIPVISTDLPVFGEIALDAPNYLAVDDLQGWQDAIAAAAQNPCKAAAMSPDLLSWDKHFHKLAKVL